MTQLALHDVAVRLDGRELLRVDARATAAAPLTVMGPSGSGKSSLLAWLGGFLAPAFTVTGTATLDGAVLSDLPAERRRLGLLFQDPLLFPHLSVLENLLFALPRGGTRAQRRAQAETALAQVELAGFGARDPDTLSGGQKARVALVRVLLSRPRALLLDEPFSKLDAGLRDEMRAFTRDHVARLGIPALLVTHDPDDARIAGGAVVTLRAA